MSARCTTTPTRNFDFDDYSAAWQPSSWWLFKGNFRLIFFANLRKAEGIELEVARVTLALDGLEEGDAAENLEEGSPQEDLRHAARLDENVVSLDGGKLSQPNH